MMHTYQDSQVMEDLIKSHELQVNPPQPGNLVEGTVISVVKNRVLVDLGGFCTGVITGQESYDSFGTVKTLQSGDSVFAYVLEEENADGLVVLSLRKASQERTWKKFTDAYESNKSIAVSASEANKGGLLVNIDGIKGFIPVSQLAPLHYPRVDGADANKILERLQKLVGVPLNVRILSIDREGGKLVLSEKAAEEDVRMEALNELEMGQILKGRISGIVKFGIFVTFDGLEGLVHISEIAWGHVKNPKDYGKLGDEVEVMVIGKERDKISLSMKRLTDDPWVEATKKYKVGNVVEGEVTRVTPFGAFVKLEEEINGLLPISEIMDGEAGEDLANAKVKVGDKVEAKVTAVEVDEHKVTLALN